MSPRIKDITAEPDIQVGIILPEDRQKTVTLRLPATWSGDYPTGIPPSAGIITISCDGFSLLVNGIRFSEFTIGDCANRADQTQAITVEPLIAGRGFHWQKAITMEFLGQLVFTVYEGYILGVNRLPLELYLMCVATSEMGSQCPPALIQAQTIVARSFILANAEKKHRDLGFDFCNDDCCQRYHGIAGLTQQSIRGSGETRGQVIVYEDQICDARYSKSCGGMMENFANVWGPPNPAYFQCLPDGDSPEPAIPIDQEAGFRDWIQNPPIAFCSPETVPESSLNQYLGGVDENGQYYRWTFTFSQSDLTNLVNEKTGWKLDEIHQITPLKRGGSGRIIEIEVKGLENQRKISRVLTDQYEIRRIFHPGFLLSSAFLVETDGTPLPQAFTLRGAGWGHGAGLCQIGALGMALEHFRTAEILIHYYPETQLITLYP